MQHAHFHGIRQLLEGKGLFRSLNEPACLRNLDGILGGGSELLWLAALTRPEAGLLSFLWG
jgi:hypothetical protein